MAGLTAAVTALEAGADVTVLEKGTRAGGSMAMSAGLVWTFSDTAKLHSDFPDGYPELQPRRKWPRGRLGSCSSASRVSPRSASR
jgi:glycine/D-amino acid oxidase-like deaminating enzyme